ncbi:MAG: NYN domain-containing protein [Planctomycetota bacterium]
MRFEYIIDGYNFLQARTGTRVKAGPGNLERSRNALLGWLAKHCPEPASITVVFDAASEEARRLTHPRETIEKGIRVLFASGHPTADELIAELCNLHHHPKQLGVVSNDRAVLRSAKKCGARPLGCEAFEKLLLQRSVTRPASTEPREKSVGPQGLKESIAWCFLVTRPVAGVEELMPEPPPLRLADCRRPMFQRRNRLRRTFDQKKGEENHPFPNPRNRLPPWKVSPISTRKCCVPNGEKTRRRLNPLPGCGTISSVRKVMSFTPPAPRHYFSEAKQEIICPRDVRPSRK